MNQSNYQRTAEWLKACGKEPGNAANLSTQIGCHLEEFVEFLETIRLDSEGGELIANRVGYDLAWLANKLKKGDYTAHIAPHLRAAALDALCDSEVTGNGVAYIAGFDKEGADAAVLNSNDDKLVDGKPIIQPGGKIGKRPGWKAPDLSGFIGNAAT